MSNVAIEVENISKLYYIGHRQGERDTLRRTARRVLTAPVRKAKGLLAGHFAAAAELDEPLWALKDVSFQVQRGEVMGLIGKNGAGKSTLLKILSRITPPTSGRAIIHGRVGSLLEVGTGFHPELTGRENVYLNGTMLGMKRIEVRRKFDDIVEFAEIERFIDTPVKHYSSGMYTRLAFAVAAHLEPEIMIVDEVLAVGDVAFQNKCLDRMRLVAGHGRTVLFVSHNMAAVANLCSRIVALKEGRVWRIGGTSIINEYLDSLAPPRHGGLANRPNRPCGGFHLTGIRFADQTGRPRLFAVTGEPFQILLDYESGGEAQRPDFAFSIAGTRGEIVMHCNSYYSSGAGQLPDRLPPRGTILCKVARWPVTAGQYRVNLLIHRQNAHYLDHIPSAASLIVEDGDFFHTGRTQGDSVCRLLVEHGWEFQEEGARGDPTNTHTGTAGDVPCESH